MTILLLSAILTLAGLSSAGACRLDHMLVAEHSSDYGPGGIGLSYRFEISPAGKIKLTTRRWRVPDGIYVGVLSRPDWEHLSCLLADVVTAFPQSPEMWFCPHAPSFSVTDAETNRSLSRCISEMGSDPLKRLYALLPDVVCRARWDNFAPAPPDPSHYLFVAPSPPPCPESRDAKQGA
jgi:hypothetical protein